MALHPVRNVSTVEYLSRAVSDCCYPVGDAVSVSCCRCEEVGRVRYSPGFANNQPNLPRLEN